jgi:hypothetical protein
MSSGEILLNEMMMAKLATSSKTAMMDTVKSANVWLSNTVR